MLARDEVTQWPPQSLIDRDRSLHLHKSLKGDDRLVPTHLETQVPVLDRKAGAAIHARQAARTIKWMVGSVRAEPSLIVATAKTTLKRGNDNGNVFCHIYQQVLNANT